MQRSNRRYINIIQHIFVALTWLIIPCTVLAQETLPVTTPDTTFVVSDSTITSRLLQKDSIQVSSSGQSQSAVVKKQKSNQIEDIIHYKANDSIVFFANGTGFLHGTSEITYQKIKLTADFVRVKMDSSILYARGTTDSIGERKGEPVFNEGDDEYSSREITYNLKNGKGFIRQAVTQQGEGYIISDKTKKNDEDILCIAGGKYTTCDNHDHPHFYLSLSKGKVKPGEYVVTGPAHLVIADVPLPVAVPFGFFPFTDKYSSGFLMPSWTDELTRGFGLTNGGWYFAINDFIDLDVKGDIYTKGTWALNGTSTYVKRYKYRGNINISYREDVTGEKDLPNYSKAKNFSVRWSHTRDTKANPYLTFSSSVNFSTSGYNRSNINSYYRPELNSENTKSSSISFNKRFADIPSLNVSGSMLLSQRTKDSTLSISLPNINLSYSRFNPLKRKNAIGKERWYEKISMSYTGTLANSIDNVKEYDLMNSSFSRDWRNGMRHSIPVSANFNLLKYINISPSFNYTERWYGRSINRSWDKETQKEVIDTISGFNRVFDFNMGVSASTKLYGFYIPIRSIFGDKIDRIRHVISPSIGFSYVPDFGDPRWGYYDSYTRSVLNNTTGAYTDTEVTYSHYAGSLYGSPGAGKTGSITFSLGNNVEMKVRNDNDTTGTNAFKKISLIDNLSFNGSYNLAADSMRWSNIGASLRLKLTKTYSLSLSTSFDPYMYGLNASGRPVRINQLRWENGKFPRFMGTSTSYSVNLNNQTFNKWMERISGKEDKKTGQGTSSSKSDTENDADDAMSQDTPTGNQSQDKAQKTMKGDYQKVTIPWNISVSYSVRYGNASTFNTEKMEYDREFFHSLNFSGNISPTPNLRISVNPTFNFETKSFTYVSFNVSRSLHCWSMSANFVPIGPYKSYNIHIRVNSSMLSDLKYDKQSYPANNIVWY